VVRLNGPHGGGRQAPLFSVSPFDRVVLCDVDYCLEAWLRMSRGLVAYVFVVLVSGGATVPVWGGAQVRKTLKVSRYSVAQ
jgi:hypothetical protein